MSDSEDSTVTYTTVSIPFGGLSDIRSPGVDGPPVMPEDPYAYVVATFQDLPSPDYVPDLEEPEQAPPLPEFVPEPVYPEFMPLEDDVLLVKEQTLPTADSPTIDSPGYILEFDPEEDPADYPTDRDDDKEDSVLLPSDIEVAKLLVIPTPPASPLSSWSLPLPQIPSPPLPPILSPPLPVSSPPLPASPTYPLGYGAAMIQLRAKTPSTSHLLPLSTPPLGTPPLLHIPAPTSSPSLLLPSVDHRADKTRVCLPPRKRLCIALDPMYEIRRDLERDIGYGITNTWDEILEDMPGAPATDETELGQRMANFVTTVRHDIDEIYVRLGEAQDERSLMSGRLSMLFRDRRDHAHTALLMEREARISCEAWRWSMDAINLAGSEVMALRTQVVAHQSKIAGLRAADRTRQKMAPKRTTRSTLAATTATTTTVTNAQLKAMIDQGVTSTLAARDADRSMNGDDNHNSGTGVRRNERATRDISNCFVENQVKFSTCTLLGSARTWWNSHIRTVGHDVAYAMTWANLKKKMTDKYCPRTEIKKLEAELWNLKVKESNKIERYIGGLPDMIHRSVVASKPKTMQEAIEIATELMDKKIRSGEKKPYGGSKPLYPKCNYHHDGPCAPKCHKCDIVGHLVLDCRSPANTNARNNQRGTGAVYAVGRAWTNPDSNVVMGTFLLKNRYVSVLFDTGADRSFMYIAFSSQIDIMPSTLDRYYDVELADGRIIRLNAIIRGCTLYFSNHPFNIDLMPLEIGSLDIIIDMDWLAKYQAIIVCAEKIVRIPWEMKR
ncbi:reverse transcriptase domain-containing protein [Tanacetum coccineum]